MSVVVEQCPVCGRSAFEPFEEYPGEEVLTYVLCRSCGMVVRSPRMTEQELAAFYAVGYRQSVQASEAPTEKDLRIQAGRARHLVRFCRPVLQQVRQHLDIGSSSGALVREVHREFGSRGIGVEPGILYRQEALRRGTETVASLDELDETYRRRFDLVSLIHVLEHLPEPVRYLSNLRKEWLDPQGWLLVEVPNLFGHRGAEPAHLSIFSPQTLRQTLDLAGFRVVRMRAHGVPRSPVLKLYLTAVAQPKAIPGEFRPRPFRAWTTRLRRRLAMWAYDWWTAHFPKWAWQELPEPEGAHD